MSHLLHPQREVLLIHGVSMRLCHVMTGHTRRYWYARYTDEQGVRQKAYLGKCIPCESFIVDCVRKKSPALFPPTELMGRSAEQQQAWHLWEEEQQQINTVFRCCRCGEHPTDNPFFVICARCRSQITAGSHYRKQYLFHHPKRKEVQE